MRNRRYAPGVYPTDDATVKDCGCRPCGCTASVGEGRRGATDGELRGCEGMALAMAYVRSQPFENIYSSAEGWRRGTIFADLDLPFGGV